MTKPLMPTDLLRPVTNVRLIQRDQLRPNDYNPNAVLPENLKLLIQSILTNGWTMPIVVTPDLVIVDGYHRWMVSGIEPLLTRLGGMVPIATVERTGDEDTNVYGTITHNRARGVHQLGPMKAIVKRLIDNGKSVPEIGKQLGMRPEEVFRLSDFSRAEFLEMMTKGNHAYSEATTLVNV